MKIFVSHSTNYDFQEELYALLQSSRLNEEHEIILPHENGSEVDTKEIIKGCDLVVAEVSHPSTGQGIELGWADGFQIPIVCMHKVDSKPSQSLNRITDTFLIYADKQDMARKLEQHILQKEN